jgi:hypothetical protein
VARSYAYALDDSAPYPYELTVALHVEEYGHELIFGRRVLTVREIRDTATARRMMEIIPLVRQRKASPNWGEWDENNKAAADIIAKVHQEYTKWIQS